MKRPIHCGYCAEQGRPSVPARPCEHMILLAERDRLRAALAAYRAHSEEFGMGPDHSDHCETCRAALSETTKEQPVMICSECHAEVPPTLKRSNCCRARVMSKAIVEELKARAALGTDPSWYGR